MIKGIWGADRLPGFSDDEFFSWWYTTHGLREFGHLPVLRYVQHHTIPATRDGRYGIKPTRDGASIAWFEDLDHMLNMYTGIDRSGWSERRFSPQMDVVIGQEHVLIDGPTTPGMVKLILMARRNPDLAREEFQWRWREEQGAAWADVPGLRRYVQNHALQEAYDTPYNPDRPDRVLTHDGWSEQWYDSLDDLQRALASPEAKAVQEQGQVLFDRSSMSIVIGRELQIVP